MEQIHIKVGRNLHRIRKARGLSLDKVAEVTGVSKAMLAQIERGDTNPTISILWKIATGLKISFTTLVEEESPEISVVRTEALEPFLSEEGAYRTYPLFPFNSAKQFEVYSVEIDPGCVHPSEPHNEGVEEWILVFEGDLEVEIGNEAFQVCAGSAIHFPADRPHVYRNLAPTVTRFHVIIHYPN